MAANTDQSGVRSRHKLRCAIYTRKSTEEGLDQAFNSLDAQREACAAYVASQAGEGWLALPTLYDDGGFSGGNMERPALKRLMGDIGSDLIDIVVVYKVDRLTRSLSDFAKIVDGFEQNNVAFISVTQSFNTTTSMGRLTLNVLLSFAQFEREVTAERIRDKVASSKAKGIWMGGQPPLGYDAVDKRLVVNASEAKTVRTLFELYLETGSLRALKEIADRRGIVTKIRMRKGVETGCLPFSVGQLRQVLTNPIYFGKVRYRGKLYEGQQDAVIPDDLFERVQKELAKSAPVRRSETNAKSPHRLTGKVFDETGDRLSPAGAYNKGLKYHYYVSRRLIQGRRSAGVDGWRLPARILEDAVSEQLVRWLCDRSNLFALVDDGQSAQAIEAILKSAKEVTAQLKAPPSECSVDVLGTFVRRVDVSSKNLTIELNSEALLKLLGCVGEIAQSDRPVGTTQKCSAKSADHHGTVKIAVPWSIKCRVCERHFVITTEDDGASVPDPGLINLITTAHRALALLTSGEAVTIDAAAKHLDADKDRLSRSLRLSFLAPDITTVTLTGRQPPDLTVQTLFRIAHLPRDWTAQRRLLNFRALC